MGGSADLYPSTKTLIKDGANFERNSYGGRNFHFGIREHAMGSILNGMALSCCGRSAPPSSSSPTTCARRSAWQP